jgi:hypothetical protein
MQTEREHIVKCLSIPISGCGTPFSLYAFLTPEPLILSPKSVTHTFQQIRPPAFRKAQRNDFLFNNPNI